jgi:uncharacterized protein with ParB-like and HNH nuclease domain
MASIHPLYKTIDQLLKKPFSIDEYQREYKWSISNIDDLLDDLLGKFQSCYRAGDATDKVRGYEDYFLGSVIVTTRNDRSFLIDGQQRVTSLTLLLIYLHRVTIRLQRAMIENHRDAEQEVYSTLNREIAPLIYGNDLGTLKFNLDIPERHTVLKALFDGAAFTPDGKDESIQNMYERYQQIESRALDEELGDALPHFIYWLLTKVGLIEIATSNDNYAYAIFETMNDRGKPLSPIDMFKAYLLAPVEDPNHRRNANQVWKQQVRALISASGESEKDRDANCIKAWLRAQYAESIRDRQADSSDKDWELIGKFHRWSRDNHARLNLGNESSNLRFIHDDFPFFAKAYNLILNASEVYTKGLESVFYVANNEFTWQNTVLLSPLCASDDADTVRKKIQVTATYIDIWLIRRVVNYVRIGYSSTSYAMFKLCVDIRRKSLEDLVSTLSERLKIDDITFEGYKSRQRLGLDDFGLNQFSRRYIAHILARITSYVETESGQPDLFPSYVDRQLQNSFDIEHIWPNDYQRYQADFSDQADFQRIRGHIASLLLLPADVNRSLQDKSFEQKVSKYGSQNLFAASLYEATYRNQPQFLNFKQRNSLAFEPTATFGKKEQNQRRELVTQLVNLIWSPERLRAAAE